MNFVSIDIIMCHKTILISLMFRRLAMFNQQFLYERQMAVRMDKWVDPILQDIPNRMPVGLKGIGSGFGTGGQPLLNIAQISSKLRLHLLHEITVHSCLTCCYLG